MSSFDKQWKDNLIKLNKHIERAVVQSANETFSRIVDDTPVGDPSLWNYPAPIDYVPGTLSQSWEISFNNGSSYLRPRAKRSFGQRLEAGRATINKIDDIIMRNQTPYAQRIEFGSWSTQRPQGMVRINIKMFPVILEKNVRKNKI